MIGYIFYSKIDSSKEPISSWPANSLEEAIDKFAKIKKLPVEEFNKLYTVEEYDRA